MSEREVADCDLRAAYEAVGQLAARSINENAPDEHPPVIACVQLGEPGKVEKIGAVLVGVLYGSEAGKDIVMMMVKSLLAGTVKFDEDFRVDCIVQISEAWSAYESFEEAEARKKAGIARVPPAEHPSRKEVLLIAVHKPGHTEARYSPIVGEGEERRCELAPWDQGPNAPAHIGGRMVLDEEPSKASMH
jgi:hypothetical protein